MTPAAIRIDDPDDPRIAAYRAVRERDLVGREGLFVAEGRVVLEKAVAAGRHPLRSVLVAEHRLESLAGVLAGLPGEVPIYAAAQAVMDAAIQSAEQGKWIDVPDVGSAPRTV